MNFAQFIKEIGRGAEGAKDLTREEARQLYGAMLDGGVPDLELGAILIALRMKGETNDEMAGFLAAAQERLQALHVPAGRIRPVVIPSYNGARKGANLTPLLALLLQRFGVPVLVHGLLDTVVDDQFAWIETLDERVEELESQLFDNRQPGTPFARLLFDVRKELVTLRRIVLPMREVVASIMRHRRETDGDPSLDPWFDDLYDHSLRAAEWADSLRDLVTTIFETNMSLQDTRLNRRRMQGAVRIIQQMINREL